MAADAAFGLELRCRRAIKVQPTALARQCPGVTRDYKRLSAWLPPVLLVGIIAQRVLSPLLACVSVLLFKGKSIFQANVSDKTMTVAGCREHP